MKEKQFLVSESELIQKIMGMRFLDTTDEKIEQIKDFLKSKQPVQKLDRGNVEKILHELKRHPIEDVREKLADKILSLIPEQQIETRWLGEFRTVEEAKKFMEEMRKCIPPQPKLATEDEIREIVESYYGDFENDEEVIYMDKKGNQKIEKVKDFNERMVSQLSKLSKNIDRDRVDLTIRDYLHSEKSGKDYQMMLAAICKTGGEDEIKK